MIRVAVAGLGKMGLSHLSIINSHPRIKVEAICDSTKYLLDILEKYTRLKTYSEFDTMLADIELDAVIIATPTGLHEPMVAKALERNLHVFCEKPFCLYADQGIELVKTAEKKGLVTQVGYHYRFVGAFREVKRLLDADAIGEVSHILAESYGPVVLRDKGGTWRSRRQEGGGCLYDYAAHPINLVNWYLGAPAAVGGTVLNRIFSGETDDEVFSTLQFDSGQSAQISVNWSDESSRKMTTKITVWGKAGRIYADRQECQVYLRDNAAAIPDGYRSGWNIRYTTDLTEPVWFYLRGEEYSAQIDHFIQCIEQALPVTLNSFGSALDTDRTIAMMIADSLAPVPAISVYGPGPAEAKMKKRFGFFPR